MQNAVVRRRAFESDRLHHAAARRGTITRIIIDMLGPETHRAVIGVAGAFYGCAAVLAGEILNDTYKGHTYWTVTVS